MILHTERISFRGGAIERLLTLLSCAGVPLAAIIVERYQTWAAVFALLAILNVISGLRWGLGDDVVSCTDY